MFDCLSWHTDDNAEGVARPVVACRLVHIDLVPTGVNRWIGLFGAWPENGL